MNEEFACKNTDAMKKAAGERHGQIHPQIDERYHGHYHGQICPHAELNETNQDHANLQQHGSRRQPAHPAILTIRSQTGISGDILLCGLALLHLQAQGIVPDSPEADRFCADICKAIMPELESGFAIRSHSVNGIGGWQARIDLPHAHEHRNLEDIKKIIAESGISQNAKNRATHCFELLALCEGAVHGLDPADVHFHEVGALDSILDICATCELYEQLDAPLLICSPLPIADGQISCAHGLIPAPAPAVLKLLQDIPLRPFAGSVDAGELVTPTGIALLRSLNSKFGKWPAFAMQSSGLIYGQREFADCPNGVIFAIGSCLCHRAHCAQ